MPIKTITDTYEDGDALSLLSVSSGGEGGMPSGALFLSTSGVVCKGNSKLTFSSTSADKCPTVIIISFVSSVSSTLVCVSLKIFASVACSHNRVLARVRATPSSYSSSYSPFPCISFGSMVEGNKIGGEKFVKV